MNRQTYKNPVQKRRNGMEKLQLSLKSLICISLLTAFLGCAATPKGPSAGQSVDDSLITTKVESALFYERSLRNAQINVRTKQGVVRLTGVVVEAPNVERATKIASGIPGVVGVENVLAVKE